MKFLVTRTSNSTAKPCEGAVKEKYIRRDLLDISKNKEAYTYDVVTPSSEWWYSEGTNHRKIEDGDLAGCLARDIDDEGWFIELSSLEDLIKFQENIAKKGDSIILSDLVNNKGIKQIEIYDWYRE